jgi:hypothetical protein
LRSTIFVLFLLAGRHMLPAWPAGITADEVM